MQNTDHYSNNPLIHADRRLGNSRSQWVRSFTCTDMHPLIICRGPIRKEAMDVFDEMGIDRYGILLSEKDSITYTHALAPELRKLTDPSRVHRVPDYTGASKEERNERIQQIISIAHENGYNAVFAGYGFMAEDEDMVRSMESAGLNFIGPCSQTVRGAGLKDEAKRTALEVGVSVTPGLDNATALTLLKKYPDVAALKNAVNEFQLELEEGALNDGSDLEVLADRVLASSYRKGIDIISIEELGETLQAQVASMFEQYQGNRIRLKAISGGGGKGQRILASPASFEGSPAEQIAAASARVPELVREILAEVKCNGVGDNKNILAELNIETTRHNEIQVIGNGDWCMTMGGRDCSLQMHEQKLLEVSITLEELKAAAQEAENSGRDQEADTLRKDFGILEKMEAEASAFGAAVGLDSVSTFECIVDGDNHFFMEMNTRIQVEHRVTELCYKLKFSNPDDASDFFIVESLVEAMVLLARHGERLPKPSRIVRKNSSVEARMNATNQALQPHAGGLIDYWSDPIPGEIRDDQGISMHNPDTGEFMRYHLAGAYDSNIALLLTTGDNRTDCYSHMAEVLRQTDMRGKELSTNLQFHYGLVNWFIGNGINARPTTRFIVPYLTAVGLLKEKSNNLDLQFAYRSLCSHILAGYSDVETRAAAKEALDRKTGLLLRPLELLFAEPHILAGWLSVHQSSFAVEQGKIQWLDNPIRMLADLYHYRNMDYVAGAPAADMIWSHDNDVLQRGLAFYASLEEQLGIDNFTELSAVLDGACPEGIDADQWQQIQSAHAGFQLGTEILSVLPYVGLETGFFELTVNADLSITIPERLTDSELQDRMAKVLVPPPVAKSDEILAFSGGMYYPREAPGMDVFVDVGDHFNEGDPLYIVEVMKMFNKVYATFSGTVDKVLVEGDGTIIKKGQPLFKVTPDEKIEVESAQSIKARKQQQTQLFLDRL